MSFWKVEGAVVDGSEHSAHAAKISIIPEGTRAPAAIKEFTLEATDGHPSHYQVIWKLTAGDFKNYEVRHKINCFDQDTKKKTRALNMLMRLFKLSGIQPAHANVPTDADLKPMIGKVFGIEIREWAMPKKDGSGISEGNWVSGVWASDDNFVPETGVKQVHEVISSHLETAFSRNPMKIDQDADIPF